MLDLYIILLVSLNLTVLKKRLKIEVHFRNEVQKKVYLDKEIFF